MVTVSTHYVDNTETENVAIPRLRIPRTRSGYPGLNAALHFTLTTTERRRHDSHKTRNTRFT